MKRFLMFYFVLYYVKVSICLRVVGISVPSLKQRGEPVTLTCDYDLEGGKLYSVKWYRDNEEFYRYMPRLRPPQHAHRIDGVRVDLEKSSARRVHLRELTLKSRGLYRCEVSEEAPSFHSAQSEAFMEIYCHVDMSAYNHTGPLSHSGVFSSTDGKAPREQMSAGLQAQATWYQHKLVFPRDSPRIVGHEQPYELLEPLDVNCSSAKAFPAPDLQWHIDGQKVTDRSLLVAYGAKPAPQGLLISTLGLRAPALPRMKLRCVASIGPHKRERTVIIEVRSASSKNTSHIRLIAILYVICSIYRNLL